MKIIYVSTEELKKPEVCRFETITSSCHKIVISFQLPTNRLSYLKTKYEKFYIQRSLLHNLSLTVFIYDSDKEWGYIRPIIILRAGWIRPLRFINKSADDVFTVFIP